MRYLLAWICPPLAVLLCGRPFSAVLNCVFTLFFWMPGVFHANAVVNDHLSNKRNKRLVRAINHPKWADGAFTTRPERPVPMVAPRPRAKAVEVDSEYAGSYTVGRAGTVFRKRS